MWTGHVQLTTYQVILDYSYFTAEEVLRAILPEGVEVPTAFESVGHIAHLNLREQQLPYKRLIARVSPQQGGLYQCCALMSFQLPSAHNR
jgi:tRNA G37 N-methylase Trm5